MKTKLGADEIVARIRSELAHATVDYDAEADELELRLPSGEGRAGSAVVVEDDAYLRIDPETHEPLSVVILPFVAWLEHHAGDKAVEAMLQIPLQGRFSTWQFPGPLLCHWGPHAAGAIEQTVRGSGAQIREGGDDVVEEHHAKARVDRVERRVEDRNGGVGLQVVGGAAVRASRLGTQPRSSTTPRPTGMASIFRPASLGSA